MGTYDQRMELGMGQETSKGRINRPETDELWVWRAEGPGLAAWVGDGRQYLLYDPRKQERKQVWRGWWQVKIQNTVPPGGGVSQTF